jgi:hypothetical protein
MDRAAPIHAAAAPDRVWHLCCVLHFEAPAVVPDVPSVILWDRAARNYPFQRFIVVIAPGAVRAGLSQAPPGQA